MVLDYPGGPSAITRVFKREEGRQKKTTEMMALEGFSQTLLAFKWEEEGCEPRNVCSF